MTQAVLILTLVIGGASDYRIVLSKDASPTEQFAAKELAAFLKEMSGADLPILAEDAVKGDAKDAKLIVIGDGELARKLGVAVDAKKLGEDGFVLRATDGGHLVIAGGRARGTLYGVYEVLSMLGCRWWAPGESTIPKAKDLKLSLPPAGLEKVPALEYRDLLYGDLWLGSNKADASPADKALWLEGRRWMARNYLHAAFHELPDELGPISMDSAIAHRMINYLPAEKYKKDHPEWYALRGDKRMDDHICLANEEAAKETARNVIAELDKHPTWRLITLGQADNGNFCTCPECKALVEKHKANSGMILVFINRVAKIVKEKYPSVYINTNAYRWSQTAPEGIRCDDNVMITIPPIACNYSEPLANGWPQENADYKRDLENWGKLTNKIYVWDYTTNFVHYVMPWPNWQVIGPNVRFFLDNKVRGIFNQGSHTTDNGQFSKMTMWVLAQQMWNPQADSMVLAKEFCLGYYGPQAGPLIYEYVTLLADKVVKEKIPVWATHRTHLSAPYLTGELIGKAEKLFRQAEAAVKADPVLLKRVEIAHFPILYTLIKRPNAHWEAVQKAIPDADWSKVCVGFARIGRAAGISRVAEGDGATQLFDWADDVAKKTSAADTLPAELKEAKAGTFIFIDTAQFDQQVRFLTKVDGATDGWAQRISGHGWSITNELLPSADFTVGKTYKFYVRVMGKAKAGATGKALQCGIHNPKEKRVSVVVDDKLMDGQWHTVEVGTWTPAASGGSVYVCWDPNATATGMFVEKGPDGKNLPPQSFIDCLWLVEQPASGDATK